MTTKINLQNFTEILFENRHKNYGAYDIRTQYPEHIKQSLSIAFLFLISLVLVTGLSSSNKPVIKPYQQTTIFTDTKFDPKIFETGSSDKPKIPKHVSPPKPIHTGSSASAQNTPPILTDLPIDETPVAISPANNSISNPSPGSTHDIPNVESTTGEIINADITSEGNQIIDIPDEFPEFIGGDEGLQKFIQENLKFPYLALESGISDKAYIEFIVEKDGSISEVEIKRDLKYGCGLAAKNVVAKMPKWKPGKSNKRNVRVKMLLPIHFSSE